MYVDVILVKVRKKFFKVKARLYRPVYLEDTLTLQFYDNPNPTLNIHDVVKVIYLTIVIE